MRPEVAIPCCIGLVFFLIPIAVGFTWLRQDADRLGQPGTAWAILTIPFGWLTILAYVIVRVVRSGPPPTSPINSSHS